MRFIIIGGSGFVGGFVIKHLREFLSSSLKAQNLNAQILNLDLVDSQKCENFVCFDVTRDNFTFEKDDVLIYLCARAYAPKPPRSELLKDNLKDYFFSVNVYGLKRILQQVAKAGVRNMIYFSTDMVYGKPQHLPVSSSHPRNPFGNYGASKLESENLIFEARKNGLNALIFRPRIIVGAGRYGILTKLFRLMELNLPIPMIGSGENCYQMISVSDCARAVIAGIEKGLDSENFAFPNAELNLGSHNPPKIKDLLKFVIDKSGSKSILLPTNAFLTKSALAILEKLGFALMYSEQFKIADEQYIVDISQAFELLGWQPLETDCDMLLAAFDEYKNAKNKPNTP